ncbi:MAG: hypothetical protein AAF717_12825 [Bacteroidota bacterium]
MKKAVFYLLTLFFWINLVQGQRKINYIKISEGSQLTIEAKAETVNNVTFTISPSTNTDEKDLDDIRFPYQIKVAPFNEKTFNDNFLQFLKQVEVYQSRNLILSDLLQQLKNTEIDTVDRNVEVLEAIKKSFTEELKKEFFQQEEATLKTIKEKLGKESLEKIKTKFTAALENILKNRVVDFLDKDLNEALKVLRKQTDKSTTSFYQKQLRLQDRIRTIYRYFDDQIVLLFEYDTEPVAGTLYYNSTIENVQYFSSSFTQTHLYEKKKNYGKLLRELNKIVLNSDSINEAKNRYTIEFFKSKIDQDSLNLVIKKEVLESVGRVKSELEDSLWYQFDWFKDAIVHLGNKMDEAYYKLIPRDEAKILLLEFDDFEDLSDSEKEKYIQGTLSLFYDNDMEISNFRENLITRLEEERTNFIAKVEFKKYPPIERLLHDYFKNYYRSELIAKKGQYLEEQYIKFPEKFVKIFKNIIYDYSSYSEVEKYNFIEDQILEIENKKAFDALCPDLNQFHKNQLVLGKLKDKPEFDRLIRESYKNARFISRYDSNQRMERELKELADGLIKNDSSLEYLKNASVQQKIEGIQPEVSRDTNPRNVILIQRYLDNFQWLGANDSSRYTDVVEELRQSFISLKKIVEGNSRIKELIQTEEISVELFNNPFDINDFKDFLREIQASRYDENGTGQIFKLQKAQDSLKIVIKSKLKKAPLRSFKPERMELDFNDGFIENIVVFGKIFDIKLDENNGCNEIFEKILKTDKNWIKDLEQNVKFVNDFPFGFSSSKDYDDFKESKLTVYEGRIKKFVVKLGKIFPNYVQKLANNRLDYSPKNEVVIIRQEDMIVNGINSISLRKETSSKLFNFSVYTDFVGFQDNPNGTVQVEFSKLIPLYTKRNTARNPKSLFGRQGNSYGYLNYVLPQLRWSRLETSDNSKNLVLSYQTIFEGSNQRDIPFVTILDLLRYENISVGGDLNILSFDFPQFKSRVELNLSGRYGRTKILDTGGEPLSVSSDSTNAVSRPDVNTWRYYPEFIFRLRPEERYGANISYRPIRFNTVTTDFSVVSSADRFRQDLSDDPQWLQQFEINAHYSPSGRRENRFFFRYRYTTTAGLETNGFSEIQLGYSLSLRVNNKK